MIMKTDIITPRVFIPRLTGGALKMGADGVKVLGYDTALYDFCKEIAHNNIAFDKAHNFRELYDVVTKHYSIDLSHVPQVYPYIAWVDWCKKNGGVMVYDKDRIEEVKRECNTLIIPDKDECDYLYALYTGYKPISIPERFRTSR